MVPYNVFELIASAAAAIEPVYLERNKLPADWLNQLTPRQREALPRFLYTLEVTVTAINQSIIGDAS